ncbi:P-loop containing nucleoside triphosphate hydrolase protein [Hypoxylon rubiginosum]|uniref:P-loop containing nucleoside triphosphate hydrolase protein n=1 Tax=Hypoxylon rubiginosum TaxID=110542 RepID=A0ACC0D720_9PEZI|nr:P-loop containing nucleoside triphosphate hydrolase protein [Hypoxylon rubiginosum]
MFERFATAIIRYFSRIGSLASLLNFFTTRHDLLLESTAHGTTKSTSAKPLFIFILGAPGVGKGTISAFLKTAVPGLTHLSYGDLTRYYNKIPGSWVSSFPRRRGTNNPLLPARDAAAMLRATIDTGVRKHGQRIWLLDGFPRTAEHVAEMVAQLPPPDCTLYLFCLPEVSMQRIAGRAATSGRPDDANAARVEERVARINAESGAMLEALEAAGMHIATVDANRDLETVKEEVLGHVQVGYFNINGLIQVRDLKIASY